MNREEIDSFEFFARFGKVRVRYETPEEEKERLNVKMGVDTSEMERKLQETIDMLHERFNEINEKRKNHPAFLKPGTVIKSIVEKPVMFRKPIEQFFDVSEAVIVE